MTGTKRGALPVLLRPQSGELSQVGALNFTSLCSKILPPEAARSVSGRNIKNYSHQVP